METILIPTDFSEASRNAAFYGVKLAALLGARVVLLNVYPFVQYTTAGPMITAQELKESSMKRLRGEIKWLDTKGSVEISRRSIEGDPGSVIVQLANELKANWIIAGMKGSTKAARKIFGGTAYWLSQHSDVPVILVPEFACFKAPQVIAFASNITHETNMHILDPLKEFGDKLNSHMFIVRVITKAMDEVVERLIRPERLKRYLHELHPVYEFVNGDDVADSMNEFVKQHGVDIVVMAAAEHNLFDRMFVKSNIKEMIIQTHVPLVILPGKMQAEEATEPPASSKTNYV